MFLSAAQSLFQQIICAHKKSFEDSRYVSIKATLCSIQELSNPMENIKAGGSLLASSNHRVFTSLINPYIEPLLRKLYPVCPSYVCDGCVEGICPHIIWRAAYGELVSIGGLSPDVNKKISGAIADILETKLSVPKARYFLKFYDTKYVMVVLKGSVPISFGGTEQPAAYGEFVSIGGLSPDVNKKISGVISDILETKLSVPKARYFLKFYDTKGSNFGWNGSTF